MELNQTSLQPESVYQGIPNSEKVKSTDDYLSPDATTLSNPDAVNQSIDKSKCADIICHVTSVINPGQFESEYEDTLNVSTSSVSLNKDAQVLYVNANIRRTPRKF